MTVRDYRDVLREKGINPVVIQRTEKKPGQIVLRSWCQPVRVVETAPR